MDLLIVPLSVYVCVCGFMYKYSRTQVQVQIDFIILSRIVRLLNLVHRLAELDPKLNGKLMNISLKVPCLHLVFTGFSITHPTIQRSSFH